MDRGEKKYDTKLLFLIEHEVKERFKRITEKQKYMNMSKALRRMVKTYNDKMSYLLESDEE